MFVFGFGELAMRGHSLVERYEGIGTRRVHFGYLTAEQYRSAYDYVLERRAKEGLPIHSLLVDMPVARVDGAALLAEMLKAPPAAVASEPARRPQPRTHELNSVSTLPVDASKTSRSLPIIAVLILIVLGLLVAWLAMSR